MCIDGSRPDQAEARPYMKKPSTTHAQKKHDPIRQSINLVKYDLGKTILPGPTRGHVGLSPFLKIFVRPDTNGLDMDQACSGQDTWAQPEARPGPHPSLPTSTWLCAL